MSCPSVTHELTSAKGPEVAHVYRAGNDALLRQTLLPIPANEEFLAAQRRVPYESLPEYLVQSKLDWEYEETRGFLEKQLSKDPRKKPEGLVVDDSHLDFCTSCPHDDGVHHTQHSDETIEVGTRVQPFVDDWVIHRWQNAIRFLLPPEKQVVDVDNHNDFRFGCPCGSIATPEGGVKLYYLSGPHTYGTEDAGSYKNRYSWRVSPNGVTGWTDEARISINDRDSLGTFTPAGFGSLPPLHGGEPLRWLAGYEAKHGGACLASSNDGTRFFNIDNDRDRETDDDDDEYNDWCLQDSNDYLGRAGDTYVQPVVDTVRQKEMVLYRKDFGEEGGWREVRGIQVVDLNQRLADIMSSTDHT